jgi:hypothetical protein
MPTVNFDRMRQAMVAAGGSINQIVYWPRLQNWRNQTLTPNPDVVYVMPFFSTKEADPMPKPRCVAQAKAFHHLSEVAASAKSRTGKVRRHINYSCAPARYASMTLHKRHGFFGYDKARQMAGLVSALDLLSGRLTTISRHRTIRPMDPPKREARNTSAERPP